LTVVALAASPAAARPYSIVARYTAPDGEKPPIVTLTDRALIPADAIGNTLEDFAISLPDDPFGLFPARAFEEVVVSVANVEDRGGDDAAASEPVPSAILEQGGAHRVAVWDPASLADATVVRLEVSVRATLSDEFLCAIESAVRERDGTARGATSTAGFYGRSRAPSRSLELRDKKTEILATYCDTVDWSAVAADKGRSEKATPDELEKRHRAALFARIKPDVETFFQPWAQLDADAPNVTEHVSFSVFRPGGMFEAYEYNPAGARELSTMVDVDSKIAFYGPKDSGWCPPFQRAPFRYALKIDGSTEAEIAITPQMRGTCELLLDVALDKLKEKTVVVTTTFDADDGKRLVLYRVAFVPRELGLVWTAPVVSEIRAITQGWNRDQLRAQSAVPLSWAVGLGKASDGVAVTLPFTISYASRSAPDLPRIVAFYPHLSALLTKSDGDSTPVTYAAGLGVAFFNSVYLSYAFGFEGTQSGKHFLLFGARIDGLTNFVP
jgi:hypothetical protein